jgi:hypothetical protein
MRDIAPTVPVADVGQAIAFSRRKWALRSSSIMSPSPLLCEGGGENWIAARWRTTNRNWQLLYLG